jgi:hypothetical protein
MAPKRLRVPRYRPAPGLFYSVCANDLPAFVGPF